MPWWSSVWWSDGLKVIVEAYETHITGIIHYLKNKQVTSICCLVPYCIMIQELWTSRAFSWCGFLNLIGLRDWLCADGSQRIQFSIALLLFGVGVATVTDLQLNVLGSVISCLAIVTTCVAQIVSSQCMIVGVTLGNLKQDSKGKTKDNCTVTWMPSESQSEF